MGISACIFCDQAFQDNPVWIFLCCYAYVSSHHWYKSHFIKYFISFIHINSLTKITDRDNVSNNNKKHVKNSLTLQSIVWPVWFFYTYVHGEVIFDGKCHRTLFSSFYSVFNFKRKYLKFYKFSQKISKKVFFVNILDLQEIFMDLSMEILQNFDKTAKNKNLNFFLLSSNLHCIAFKGKHLKFWGKFCYFS